MPPKKNNMENSQLIDYVVPQGGWYCAVGIPPVSNPSIVTKFTQSREELQSYFDDFAAAGKHVYFGLAKFSDLAPLPKDSGGGRTAVNAESFQSFWLDIDCGEDKATELDKSTGQPKGYATKKKALQALTAFCDLIDLPAPTLVDSGNGVHAYWALTEELPKAQWLPIADQLKQVCATQEFYVDRQVFDAARILRVPGTFNVKNDPPSPVVVKRKRDPIDVKVIRDALGVDEDAVIEIAPVKHKHERVSNDPLEALLAEDAPYRTDSKSSFQKIMQKGEQGCNQLLYAFKNRKTLPEPMWFHALSIAYHCEDSATAIHKLSKGHPDYNHHAVERKAANIKGPHSCAEFAKEYPAGCKGCIYGKGKDKLTSPIELGRFVVKDAAPTFLMPPDYYKGASGGIYKDIADKPVLVYPYDLYVTERMYDTELKHVAVFKVHHPMDGETEFSIPNSKLAKVDLRKELAQHGVVAPEQQSAYITQYVIDSILYLQSKERYEIMQDQFGWKENYTKFIVGEQEITGDGVYHSPASSTTEGISPHMRPKGSLEKWAEVFSLYNRPGLEIQLFAALSGFGAPLLEFTGQKGAVINLVHSSAGTGKTTVLRVINSVCGDPEMMLGTPDDTYLSRITKLGVLNNIANTMDELTNLDDKELSPFLYACSQGKGKDRMKRDTNANRVNKTTWRTLSVSSSNAGFAQKLTALKNTPDGEMMRLIEFNVPPSDVISTAEGKEMFDHQLMENYGVAIVPFIQYVINNLDEVKGQLAEVQKAIDIKCNFTSRERNWSAMIAANLTAGIILSNQSIVKLANRRLTDVLVPAIIQMKAEIKPPKDNDATILGSYIFKHHASILVVDSNVDKRTGKEHGPDLEPHAKGKPIIRYEPDTKRMYTPISEFKKHCLGEQIDYNQLKKRFEAVGFCVDTKNIRIDRGMEFSFSNVRCIIFNCNHAEYGIDVVAYATGDSDEGGESEVPD